MFKLSDFHFIFLEDAYCWGRLKKCKDERLKLLAEKISQMSNTFSIIANVFWRERCSEADYNWGLYSQTEEGRTDSEKEDSQPQGFWHF